MSPKISIDFQEPSTLPYGLYYVIASADADNEFGGTMEIEVNCICALDNKKQRPDETFIFSATLYAMEQINREFAIEAAKMGFIFSEKLASFSDQFSETDLKAGIKKLFDEYFSR